MEQQGETIAVELDKAKAFKKVWHENIYYTQDGGFWIR